MMGADVALILLIAAAVSGGTKTGRRAASNFIRSAHQATGWRTPRKAAHHYSGKAGAAAGRLTASGARASRKAAGKAGQHAVRAAGSRWDKRIADGGTGPLIWRARPQEPGTAGNGADSPGKNTGTGTGGDRAPACEPGSARQPGGESRPPALGAVARAPDPHGPAGQKPAGSEWNCFKAGDEPWKITRTGTISADNGNLTISGWVFRDPRLPADADPPVQWFNVGGSGADVLHGHSVAELHKLSHGDGCTCPVSQVTSLSPGPIRAAKIPSGAEPAPGGTGPDTPGTPGTVTAPAGARPQRKNMSARYTINLEPPSTDGEFLESCTHLGDVLKSLAEQVSNWADGLGSLNLPKSVLGPLEMISEGITEAAQGAAQSAKAFEDEFEDAREVASRGMHITGQDAA
jgi:hypothetical protein